MDGAIEDPDRKFHTGKKGDTRGTEETKAVRGILILFFWLVILYSLHGALAPTPSIYNTPHLTSEQSRVNHPDT